MYRTVSCLLMVVLWAISAGEPAQGVELAGKVDAVTVYRGQALVTRLIELTGPTGLQEVVVTDLPEHVVPGSIHAESADGVEVRSIRYRVRPVQQDVREEVRKLDEQLRELQDKLQANQQFTQLAAEQKAYLAKLEQFVAPTASVELTKGVLNAETLERLTSFLHGQRKELTKEELTLGLERRGLTEQIELLQRQRQELTGSSSRTAREAVVFVNLQGDGGRLRLRYLVSSATWSPSYNIRTDADREQVLVRYNASIQQMSGEDWADVEMTLSTATPTLVAKAPVLTPLSIALAPASAKQGAQQVITTAGGYAKARLSIIQRQRALESVRNAGIMMTQPEGGQGEDRGGDGIALSDLGLGYQDKQLNYLAGELQNLDLVARGRVKPRPTSRPKTDEGVTVTYRLAARTSLPSRSDRQLVQIAALPLEGEFYKVATPVLTSYVYEQAEVVNAGEMVLLAGPVATYVAGEFVGHSEIPTVAIGERFTVGFGIDSSLRAARELVEKTERIQGGNRVVDFTYRLALENFGTAPAAIRLLDRMPQTERGDVKLTLGSTGQDLSEDPTYRQTGHKKGILRWAVEVPGQAMGPDAFGLEYQFTLEYDKQMTIAGMPVASR